MEVDSIEERSAATEKSSSATDLPTQDQQPSDPTPAPAAVGMHIANPSSGVTDPPTLDPPASTAQTAVAYQEQHPAKDADMTESAADLDVAPKTPLPHSSVPEVDPSTSNTASADMPVSTVGDFDINSLHPSFSNIDPALLVNNSSHLIDAASPFPPTPTGRDPGAVASTFSAPPSAFSSLPNQAHATDNDIEVDQLRESELSELDEEELPLASQYPVASTSAGARSSPATVGHGRSFQNKRPRPDTTKGDEFNLACDVEGPHYTVIRSSPNTDANPHVLRIHPGITDASRDRWPQPPYLTHGYTIKGAWNWYDAQPNDTGRNLSWRKSLGLKVAEELGLTNKLAGGKDEHWILEAWPDNYKFFLHHSGKNKDRIDPYLFGSHYTAKFRTVNEFAPHLHWLLINTPSNRVNCQCKYCTKQLQSQVNTQLGYQTNYWGRSASISTAKRSRISSVQPSSAPATDREKSKEVDKGKKEKEKEKKKVLVDKDRRKTTGGLEASTSATPVSKPASVKPAPSSAPPAASTSSAKPTYKGAFTDSGREMDLAEGALYRQHEMVWTELVPPITDPMGGHTIRFWPGIVIKREPLIRSEVKNIGQLTTIGRESYNGRPVQIENKQGWKYQVLLLALSDRVMRNESQLKPWLGYETDMATDPNTITDPQSIALVYDGKSKSILRPSIRKITSALHGATPHALSMQIAAHVVASFGLNDRYQLLDSHIIDSPNLTPDELLARTAHLKQWHYQSLWWGGERIWCGELVRLMTDDKVVDPDHLSEGADKRSCFLKISGIYKNSTSGAANVCGAIYELAQVSVVNGHVGVQNGSSAMSLFEKKPSKTTKSTIGEEMFMPEPPPGYLFKRITPPGEEIHVEVEYLAGRYYPLPKHLEAKEVTDKIAASVEAVAEEDEKSEKERYMDADVRSIVLAGLLPAYRVYMHCHVWMEDRMKALKKAEEESRMEMTTFIKSARGDMTT
ncbi:hypothetical protein T439DRAFT_29001 [Meredithblackwellia eburnea MCA 4105]